MIESYLRDTSHALDRFRDTSWRCEATNGALRCRNYYVGHEKGHQFLPYQVGNGSANFMLSRLGQSFLVGQFECSFDPEKAITELYSQITRLMSNEINVETTLSLVAKASGVTSISSNRTCFTCLSNCPVYILPCENVQHTICEGCAIRFTDQRGRSQSTLLLQNCPLGCAFKKGTPWYSRTKAPAAGVRLLSLDGYV